MRAVLMLCLLMIGGYAFAKDVPLTPLWSGGWSSSEGSSLCSLRISTTGSLDLLCGFGATAVRGQVAKPERSGVEVPLLRANADLGAPPAGTSSWGQMTIFAVCDDRGPFLYTSVERNSPPEAFWIAFRPTSLDFAPAAQLCARRL